MSSGLNLTSILSQQHNTSWCGLTGLQGLTALDLGGSHFSAGVWASHMCHLLAGMTNLQRLMLAHCSIPPGKMQYLLPGLSTQLIDLNIDRWAGYVGCDENMVNAVCCKQFVCGGGGGSVCNRTLSKACQTVNMQYLLPGLRNQLVDLNIDRWAGDVGFGGSAGAEGGAFGRCALYRSVQAKKRKHTEQSW
jgi:hypothetical protein